MAAMSATLGFFPAAAAALPSAKRRSRTTPETGLAGPAARSCSVKFSERWFTRTRSTEFSKMEMSVSAARPAATKLLMATKKTAHLFS